MHRPTTLIFIDVTDGDYLVKCTNNLVFLELITVIFKCRILNTCQTQ